MNALTLMNFRRLAIGRMLKGGGMNRIGVVLVLVVVMVAGCDATGTKTITANASTTTTDPPFTAATVDQRCEQLARAVPEALRRISRYAKNGITEMESAKSDLGTATGELDTARLNFQNGNTSFAMTTLDGVASAIGGAQSSIVGAKTALATLQDTMNSAASDAEELELLTNQQPDQSKQRRCRIG